LLAVVVAHGRLQVALELLAVVVAVDTELHLEHLVEVQLLSQR
jgi:hypothetical protein